MNKPLYKRKKVDPERPKLPVGDVLLEECYHDGCCVGIVSAPENVLREMANKSDDELEKAGWLKYKSILQSYK